MYRTHPRIASNLSQSAEGGREGARDCRDLVVWSVVLLENNNAIRDGRQTSLAQSIAMRCIQPSIQADRQTDRQAPHRTVSQRYGYVRLHPHTEHQHTHTHRGRHTARRVGMQTH
mmetsp:Transcript_6344/g.18281  ORF Transcript_6344/g.18281 Transcript_6344/m.18281 type:complete len:115 (-) Transcript_6344:960-1304(-)